MEFLADKVWVLAILVATAGLLGLLHVMAVGIQNEVKVHDLKVRVNVLRQQQMERLRERLEFQQAMLSGGAQRTPIDPGEEIIEVDEEPAGDARKAA
ncbi:MAG: hypothetical protein U0637_05740 [Phycisphaerales bacterium]